MNLRRTLLSSLCLLLSALAAWADGAACPVRKLQVERLPDLHVARAGHILFCAGGELTVVGGHTSGFVPTPTAEYYADGEWHLLSTVYAHDNGCSFRTPQGDVVIAGGHSEPLGIGQTFCVERYDATRHAFTGFSCLDTKRTLCNAAPLADGRVVLSGNWYHDDDTELFDGDEHFTHARSVSVGRVRPLIFPTSDGDALIIGNHGNRDSIIDCSLADRVFGPPLRLPLFQQWRYNSFDVCDYHTSDCFIGRDAADGACSYLLPVSNAEGQMTIALLRDTVATLLPTATPIPRQGPGGAITWLEAFVADTTARRAYMSGMDNSGRLCLLAVAYDERPAALTLYHTDPLPQPAYSLPVLMPDGRIAIVGGNVSIEADSVLCNNYTPCATAYLLSLQPLAAAAGLCWLWWLLSAIVVIAAVAIYGWKVKGGRWKENSSSTSKTILPQPSSLNPPPTSLNPQPSTLNPSPTSLNPSPSTLNPSPSTNTPPPTTTFTSICQLMEQERLYLKSNLKVSDVAAMLDVSNGSVSECIKAAQGITFTQFVNGYRISHAQQLLLAQPDMKMSVLCTEAGFSNETSFFRTFKAVTGLTPREWLRSKGGE